jgi:hypothetical protein
MPVKNVFMVMRHSFFRLMSVLMYVNVTRLFIVVRVLVIINLIMFIRFIRIVGTFRIINNYEVVFFSFSEVNAVTSVIRIIRANFKQDRLNLITAI